VCWTSSIVQWKSSDKGVDAIRLPGIHAWYSHSIRLILDAENFAREIVQERELVANFLFVDCRSRFESWVAASDTNIAFSRPRGPRPRREAVTRSEGSSSQEFCRTAMWKDLGSVLRHSPCGGMIEAPEQRSVEERLWKTPAEWSVELCRDIPREAEESIQHIFRLCRVAFSVLLGHFFVELLAQHPFVQSLGEEGPNVVITATGIIPMNLVLAV
jgi:hypothetical protein